MRSFFSFHEGTSINGQIVLILHVLQLAHVDPGLLQSAVTLGTRVLAAEEAFVDDVVVHLGNLSLEPVVLGEESYQLG